MKIAVVGLYHTGVVFSACLADLGHDVVGIDIEKEVVDNLNKGIAPLAEPGLDKLLKLNLSKKKLTYTTDFKALLNRDTVWLTVDTKIDKNAKGDYKEIFDYLKKALPYIKNKTLIIVSSQIPVGTSDKIVKFIKRNKSTLGFYFAYIPENLRLGRAVESFMHPSRIVVGTKSELPPPLNKLFKRLSPNILIVSPTSAEMIKHSTNAFLATSMSFIYDIADICERVGADVTEVSRGLRADERIGEKAYLDASAGYSGGHLDRDLQYLKKISKQKDIKLPVISAVIAKNKNRSKIIFDKIKPHLNSFEGKTITFFGITYKSGTPTLTHSLPLKVAKLMIKSGSSIKLYDPWVNKDEIKKILPNQSYEYFTDPYESVKKSHVIICITPWVELKDLDFKNIANIMKKPKLFFDARNYFKENQDKIGKVGIKYIGIGR